MAADMFQLTTYSISVPVLYLLTLPCEVYKNTSRHVTTTVLNTKKELAL
jgi:hypothetical protein